MGGDGLDDEDRGGEGARGWSVMGRLRERRQVLNAEAAAAVRRLTKQKHESLRMMTAASGEAAVYQEALRAATRSGPTVLAFLFAQPYSDAIHALDSNGEYFDQRSGRDWDLFFPGYYRAEDEDLEKRAGSRPVGTNFAKGWYFNTNDFSRLRKHVQDASKARWKYSGLTDLVLICAWLEQDEEITIDWEFDDLGLGDRLTGAQHADAERDHREGERRPRVRRRGREFRSQEGDQPQCAAIGPSVWT